MNEYHIDSAISVDRNSRRLLAENEHQTLDDRIQVWAGEDKDGMTWFWLETNGNPVVLHDQIDPSEWLESLNKDSVIAAIAEDGDSDSHEWAVSYLGETDE
ncbi:MAG: hypothetical protein H6972_04025 [Gammaproteobacteria bacterium]|nr:hypothetical protein [Gammaproteobacteria bacterium]